MMLPFTASYIGMAIENTVFSLLQIVDLVQLFLVLLEIFVQSIIDDGMEQNEVLRATIFDVTPQDTSKVKRSSRKQNFEVSEQRQ
jgi:hypothetical protein